MPKHLIQDLSEREIKRFKTLKENQRKRDLEEVKSAYAMVRYWITIDGTFEEYVRKFRNPYIRYERIMFLEHEQEPEVQNHIDLVLTKVKS